MSAIGMNLLFTTPAERRREPLRTPPQLRATAQRAVAEQVRHMGADRVRQRLAQRLALRLARAHGIPPSDTSLVPWLTHEHVADNGQALALWVQQELRACDELVPTTSDEALLLTTLSASLDRLLADVAEIES